MKGPLHSSIGTQVIRFCKNFSHIKLVFGHNFFDLIIKKNFCFNNQLLEKYFFVTKVSFDAKISKFDFLSVDTLLLVFVHVYFLM